MNNRGVRATPPSLPSSRPARGAGTPRETPVIADIQITGVHFEISDRIRAYVTEKLGTLEKFNGKLSKIHVTIHHADKKGYRVDVEMHLPAGRDVIAHDSEETVYAAIDVAHDKCAAQLRKIHDREVQSHHNPSIRVVA